MNGVLDWANWMKRSRPLRWGNGWCSFVQRLRAIFVQWQLNTAWRSLTVRSTDFPARELISIDNSLMLLVAAMFDSSDSTSPLGAFQRPCQGVSEESLQAHISPYEDANNMLFVALLLCTAVRILCKISYPTDRALTSTQRLLCEDLNPSSRGHRPPPRNHHPPLRHHRPARLLRPRQLWQSRWIYRACAGRR